MLMSEWQRLSNGWLPARTPPWILSLVWWPESVRCSTCQYLPHELHLCMSCFPIRHGCVTTSVVQGSAHILYCLAWGSRSHIYPNRANGDLTYYLEAKKYHKYSSILRYNPYSLILNITFIQIKGLHLGFYLKISKSGICLHSIRPKFQNICSTSWQFWREIGDMENLDGLQSLR